jgi:hypothetical protein
MINMRDDRSMNIGVAFPAEGGCNLGAPGTRVPGTCDGRLIRPRGAVGEARCGHLGRCRTVWSPWTTWVTDS